MPGSSGDWLRYAKADLALARVPLPQGGLYELLCFHAQQAAEKSVKAVLLHYGIEPPRTHNLERLIDLLPTSISRTTVLCQSARLTVYRAAAAYLMGTVYHYCTPHARLRLATPGAGRRCVPRISARAARITDQCWSVQALLSYHVPPPRWTPPKQHGRSSYALKRLMEQWCGDHGELWHYSLRIFG